MMNRWKPIVIACFALIGVNGHAMAADEPRTVQTQFVCDEAGVAAAFDAAQVSVSAPIPESCAILPVPIVAEIVATGRFAKDSEGDGMFVVRIGDGVYTLAWPGLNAPASLLGPTV